MDAFLDAATFAQWAGRPTWSTSPLAQALLDVVSGWIRDQKPGIGDDDQAAKVVTFEVTRDAMLYGDFGPMTSFTKQTAHSMRSGTIDQSAVQRFITDRHRRMLGLPLRAGPRGRFKACDY